MNVFISLGRGLLASDPKSITVTGLMKYGILQWCPRPGLGRMGAVLDYTYIRLLFVIRTGGNSLPGVSQPSLACVSMHSG